MTVKLLTAAAVVAVLAFGAAPASAQHRGGRAVGGGHAVAGHAVVGRAVPRGAFAPRIIRPAIVGVVPYRPYYYRPRVFLGLGLGYGYGYPYGYGYGYPYYGYPYGYPAYGYGYPTPPGYLAAVPGHAYGGVRITDAPKDAAVYVDGYYVGVVDDFDGVFQHINLEAGPHRVEIRMPDPNEPPIQFDVNVRPGETITYRAFPH
jgi:hypothetical protein